MRFSLADRRIAVAVLALVAALFLNARQSPSAWLPGWKHRLPLLVTEESGHPVTDVAVRVALSPRFFPFEQCRDNGEDVRIADDEGNSYAFWIERWLAPEERTDPDAEAVIWVKIPSLSANERRRLYLYYGNALAEPYSNLSETMRLVEIVKLDLSSAPPEDELDWREIPFTRPEDVDAVLASAPTRNGREATVVRIRRQGTRWYAALAESSYEDGRHTTETVYFLGAPTGDFLLTSGARLSAATCPLAQSAGANVETTPLATAVLAPRDAVPTAARQSAAFAQLISAEVATPQERFAFARVFERSRLSAFVSIAPEFDNTLPHAATETAAVWLVDTAGPPLLTTEVRTGARVPLSLVSTDAASSLDLDATVPDGSAVFAAREDEAGGYGWACAIETSTTGRVLAFVADETAPTNLAPSTATVSLLSIPPGTYAATRFVFPHPRVDLDGIAGTVFEDPAVDGAPYDPRSDRPVAGARVRLYEDRDRDGLLTDADTFVLETTTGRDGTYHLPATGDRAYIVAVSAASIGTADAKLLNPRHSASELLPEQVSVREYRSGALSATMVPGGAHPHLSDRWTDDVAPSKNVYEHVAMVEKDDVEVVEGIDFGFSYGLVVNTLDAAADESARQGSLRQAILNANALRGAQRVRFALTKSDPRYDSLSNQYYIAPASRLPTITEALDIAGPDSTSPQDGYGVILSGEYVPTDDGLVIAAPGVHVSNLAIAGFARGALVRTFQVARPLAQPSATPLDASLAYRLPLPPGVTTASSALVLDDGALDSAAVEANGSGLASLLVPGSVATGTALASSVDGRAVDAGGRVTAYAGGPGTAVAAATEAALVAGGPGVLRLFGLDPRASLELPLPIAARASATDAGPLLPVAAGSNFVVEVREGDLVSLVPAPTGLRSSRLTTPTAALSGAGLSRVAELPATLTVPESGALAIRSEVPVHVVRRRSQAGASAAQPMPASTDALALVTADSSIVSATDAVATLFVTAPSGKRASVEVALAAGAARRLGSLPELSAALSSTSPCALRVVASAPVAVESPLPNRYDRRLAHASFAVPVDRLGSAHTVAADARGIVFAALAGGEALVTFPDGSATTTTFAGGPDEPALARLDGPIPPGTVVITRVPSLVLADSLLTGGYEPATPNTAFLDPADQPLEPGGREAFDANVSFVDCAFLANTTAVEVDSGSGVTVERSRFFSNQRLIDLGGDGPDANDGALDIVRPNEGVDRPVVTSAVVYQTTLTVEGYVGESESTPSTALDGSSVEIYLSDRLGLQASLLVGTATVSNGRFTLARGTDGLSLTSSDRLVAKLTTPRGSTSEFSDPLRVDPAPIISNVVATHIAPPDETTLEPLSTTITWSTDISSTSKVVYDVVSHAATETYAYETTEDLTLVTTHTVNITGLLPGTIYYFRVISKNADGDVTTSYEYPIPPGRAEADTDLCAFCHRAHTGYADRLRLLYIRE